MRMSSMRMSIGSHVVPVVLAIVATVGVAVPVQAQAPELIEAAKKERTLTWYSISPTPVFERIANEFRQK